MMRRIGLLLMSALLLLSCGKENENTMYVKATVKGLKKGTFYLQKQQDSIIVSVDSVTVNGSDHFVMSDVVESPEMYYLTMGNSPKKVAFFGEKDTVSITTQLDLFSIRARIKGSTNQEILDEFYETRQKFNNQKLDLIKAEFEAKKTGVEDSIAKAAADLKNWQRKKYLYTTNFAINNGDHEVSPYIALTELVDTNIGLLDTINKSLSPEVKASKYGVQLDGFVRDIKQSQNQ